MNRDKQIEEMEKFIENACHEKPADFCNINECHKCLATDLYNAGYRKSTDVAEEIFEEIEKLRMQHTFGNIDGNELNVRLYYLKKKYTEDT